MLQYPRWPTGRLCHIRLYRQHPWASGFGISRVTVRDPRTPSGLETSWRAAAWVTGTDGTADIIAKRLPDVEVVDLRQNIGAAGHNIGIHRARTPYVALCDDDTWWSPGSVHHAVTLLQAHPRLAAVSARVLVGQEQREDPTCAEMAMSPLRSVGRLPGYPILGFLAGASVVRRSAFLEAGGFHPRLFLGGEEALLAWDLASGGWTMAYVPEMVVYHYPSRHRDDRTRRRLLLRNALWLMWLRRPAGTALRQTLRLLTAAIRHRLVFPGVIQALAVSLWIAEERQVIPSHLEVAVRRLEERGPVGPLSVAERVAL